MNSPIEISKFLKNGNLSREKPLPEESQILEYKQWRYPFCHESLNELRSLYCAWLNTTGGRLIIGVEEDKKTKEGNIKGYSLTPEEMENLQDLLSFKKAKILPEPSAENIRITFIPTDKNQYVISIEIKPGDKKSLYGRDTGHLSYIKTCVWNEATQECEEVKIKLDHVQRLAEDENDPKVGGLEFAFDESFKTPESTEASGTAAKEVSEENKEGGLKEKSKSIFEEHQETRDFYLAQKLGRYIQKFSDGQLIQLLDGIEKVEKNKPYGALDVWRGLNSIQELQDACIKKLEKLIPSEPLKTEENGKVVIPLSTVSENLKKVPLVRTAKPMNKSKKKKYPKKVVENKTPKKIEAPVQEIKCKLNGERKMFSNSKKTDDN